MYQGRPHEVRNCVISFHPDSFREAAERDAMRRFVEQVIDSTRLIQGRHFTLPAEGAPHHFQLVGPDIQQSLLTFKAAARVLAATEQACNGQGPLRLRIHLIFMTDPTGHHRPEVHPPLIAE